MKHVAEKLLTLVLASALILPVTACSKGKSANGGSGGSNDHSTPLKTGTIKEDDPFFQCTEVKLDTNVAIDPTRKAEYTYFGDFIFAGENVLLNYSISYVVPPEVTKRMEDFWLSPDPQTDSEEYLKLQKEYNSYYDTGILIFNQNGELVKKIDSGSNDGAEYQLITTLPNGDAYLFERTLLPGECCSDTSVICIDSNGEKKNQFKLDEEITGSGLMSIFPVENGNLLVGTWGCIYLVDESGKTLAKQEIENFSGYIRKQDGKYYVLTSIFDMKNYENICKLQEIDPKELKLIGTSYDVSSDLMFSIQSEDATYVQELDGLKRYDLETGDSISIMNWNDADVNRLYFNGECQVHSENDFSMIATRVFMGSDREYTFEYSIAHFTRCEKNPHAGKDIINVAVFETMTEQFMDYVVKYNTDSQAKSRVNVGFYYDRNVEGADTLATGTEVDKLYLDMFAGDGPDVLVNFASMSQFNTDEVLVDMNQFIDGANGLNRDEYFDNIFRAYESNGKLYHVPTLLEVKAYAVNEDQLGGRTSWSYDDFKAVASSVPSDMSIFADMSKEDVMRELLMVSGSSFVDYEKKETYFDSEDFKKLLEIAKTYGEDPNPNDNIMSVGDGMMPIVAYDEDILPSAKLDNDILLMMRVYLNSVSAYAENTRFRNGKVKMMSLPTPNQDGYAASTLMSFAIANASKHQDEAWDFVKFMFEKEQQVTMATENAYIPVHKEALNQVIDAQYKEYDYLKKVAEEAKETGLDCYCELEYDLTEGMRGEWIAIVENIGSVSQFDSRVLAIIEEEVPAYFQDQRSVDDVCKNIQNRVQNLVQER